MRSLIVGGDCLIGEAFVRAAAEKGDTVIATTRRRETVGNNRVYLDLADDAVAETALPTVDVAFFCAAVSGFALCRADPAYARRVNVQGTGKLVRRLVSEGTYCVLLSSTAVFDFQTPYVAAETPVRPLTMHGRIKAEAEQIFLELGPSASVLRLTKVITPRARLFADWIATLQEGGKISAFSDLHIAPLRLDHATTAMAAVARDRGSGIYQLSGARDLSYLEIASHIGKMIGVSPGQIRPERALGCGLLEAEVARYTTLESSRLQALTGQMPPDPYEVIESVFDLQLASENT